MPASAKRKTSATSDPFRGMFESINIGQRIGLITEPGQFPREGMCDTGKVYGKITDRWGRHLRVKMDDFRFETVHGLTDVGIGAYLITE